MKAARIVRVNEPLQVQELQTPKPKDSQVLIKIQSSGVCHSDVHVWEGYYEGIDGQPLTTADRGVRYPLTPGHEIAGIIDSLGEQVEGFSNNEKVLVYPLIGEGLCPACRIGEENLCDKPRSLGVYVDGGYAEYVLVPSNKYLVKIGDHMDSDTSAPLSCAGLTAYGAVKNANLKPDDNVVIVGTGLGLMAIQLTKAVTGAKIIAMDLDDQKLDIAKKNGADNIINSKADVDGKSIVLTNIKGEFYAMDSVCSHEGGPLEEGTLDDYNLICPWHYGIYDIRTAKASSETDWVTDLKSYTVIVDDKSQEILIDTG
jgi:alcohol dehydrogenase, propanol-preferring